MDCERYLLRKKTREQITPTEKSWVGQGERACEYLSHHRVILSSNISRGRATVYQLLFSCREEQPFQFLSVERDLIQGITGIAEKNRLQAGLSGMTFRMTLHNWPAKGLVAPATIRTLGMLLWQLQDHIALVEIQESRSCLCHCASQKQPALL